MPDLALIEQKAARVREQAAALHRADAEAIAQKYEQVGKQKDALRQQRQGAQQAAEEAKEQAQQQHARAQEFETQAQELEQSARNPESDPGDILGDHESALETAQKLRSLAAAASERAAESHRAAAKHTAEVERLDHQVSQLQMKVDTESSATERLADQLDDMVDHLDDAVRFQRNAAQLEAAGKHGEAQEELAKANRNLEQLEDIKPDYSSVDPAVLRRAGITPADVDLVDPTVMPDEPKPELRDLQDLGDTSRQLADSGDVLGADGVAAVGAASDDVELGSVESPVASIGDEMVASVGDSLDTGQVPTYEPAPVDDGLSGVAALDSVTTFDDFSDPGYQVAADDMSAPVDDMNEAMS